MRAKEIIGSVDKPLIPEPNTNESPKTTKKATTVTTITIQPHDRRRSNNRTSAIQSQPRNFIPS
ncbi:MAG: hypothetical protein QXO71_01235 [Candidatus Jordarchaeaceae archaeon]